MNNGDIIWTQKNDICHISQSIHLQSDIGTHSLQEVLNNFETISKLVNTSCKLQSVNYPGSPVCLNKKIQHNNIK